VSRTQWDGSDLLAALRQASAELESRVDEVNALNVFPVPDGDTGSNMLATIRAAVDEAAGTPESGQTVQRVADALSLGALMGARGNSGVILSQLLRGMAAELRGQAAVDGAHLARALAHGCEAAFESVAKPVEGTILTVARDAAGAVQRAAAQDGDLEVVLAAGVAEATASVQRTPDLLPVLRQAGVVDAGGRGLELLLSGALGYVRDQPLPILSGAVHPALRPTFEQLGDDAFGYETVYVLTPADGASLDVIAIRDELQRIGESVLVAGDERAAKVHVHNERPDEVIAYGLSLGTLSRISVENLDRQARELQRGAAQPEPGAAAWQAAAHGAVLPGPAVVAVAPGNGLAGLFLTIGATAVVQGAHGGNPSAGELAEAIHGTGQDQVFVLPNNPNVRLAARQAGELCPDVEVAVIGTRNAAEGIAALLALDPAATVEGNARRMAAAADAIQTLQVTGAVRDARIDGLLVRKGEHIVLGPDDGLLAADPDQTQAVLQAVRRLRPGFELLTLYQGNGAGPQAAQELTAALRREFTRVEVEVVQGDQSHYTFLISAE